MGCSLGEKGEGAFPQVFFMRCIFDVNHLTTLQNFKSSPFGSPGSRSFVFHRSVRATQTHGASKVSLILFCSKMKRRVCQSEHIPTSA